MYWRIIIDCLLWLIVSICIALLQLWTSIGYKWLFGISLNFDDYFLSGIFLFFCSGIVISSSFDIWLEEKINKSDRVNILFHIFLPLLIIIGVVFLYTIVLSDITKINTIIKTEKMKLVQGILLISSIIYTTGSKIQLNWIRASK